MSIARNAELSKVAHVRLLPHSWRIVLPAIEPNAKHVSFLPSVQDSGSKAQHVAHLLSDQVSGSNPAHVRGLPSDQDIGSDRKHVSDLPSDQCSGSNREHVHVLLSATGSRRLFDLLHCSAAFALGGARASGCEAIG
jgi:hypothetical protein